MRALASDGGASGWPRAAAVAELGGGVVHVWRVWVELPPGRYGRLLTLLDGDEKARAARYRFWRDRCAFVATRGVLRLLLGGYLSGDPRRIRFELGKYRKPRIRASEAGRELQFNVSHSAGVALIAIAEGRAVGIDLEKVREGVDVDGLAMRFFSRAEVEALRALPSEERRCGFFRCFARKEAFAKAIGAGLHLRFDSFSVPVQPVPVGMPIDLRWSDDREGPATLVDLDPAPGFASTLVVRGRFSELVCREWAA